MTAPAGIDVQDLCFTARALAQSHPMTESSHRYRQECVETERRRQPVGELADWAGTAMLVGYCLRRSEEQRVPHPQPTETAPAALTSRKTGSNQRIASGEPTETVGLDGVDIESVGAISESLRTGDPASVSLLSAEATVSALDRIIASELDKRHEHLREQLDDSAWSELEDYISWWVIHGYALRASERPKP